MILYLFSIIFLILPVEIFGMEAFDGEKVGYTKHDAVVKAFVAAGYPATRYDAKLDELATAKLESLADKGKPIDQTYLNMRNGYKLMDDGNIDVFIHEQEEVNSLMQALRDNKPGAVKALVDAKVDLEKRNPEGKTPLMFVIQGDMVDQTAKLAFVETLVKGGAKVNAQSNKTLNSPLYYAADGQQLEIMRYLLEHHADPNLSNADDITPLMMAAMRNNLEAAQLLYSYKAGLSLTSFNGKLAYDYAKEVKKSKVAPWLKQEMKKAQIKYKHETCTIL